MDRHDGATVPRYTPRWLEPVLWPAAQGMGPTQGGGTIVEWRVQPTGRREWLGLDNLWHEYPPTGVPPTPRPAVRRRSRRLTWIVVSVAAAIALLGAALGFVSINQPVEHPPDRAQLQAMILASAQQRLTAAVRTKCVMPSSWRAGEHFVCFTYTSSGAELARIDGTVLGDNGTRPAWDEVWHLTATGRTDTGAP